MMKLFSFSFGKVLLVSASLATTSLSAVSVASDPVGVMFYHFPATSDTNIGLGLARPSVFEGRIASVDLVNNTVTFEGSPGWATDQFIATPEPHYLYIKSGDEEGMHVTVTANTADSVTVFLDTGDRLDRIVAGEVAAIGPYWTPRTFFGNAFSNGDNIRFYRDRTPKINHVPSFIIVYQDGEWYVEGTDELASDTPIFPGEGFVVRNMGSVVNLPIHGDVPMASVRIVMRANGRPPLFQDQRISIYTPVSFSIRNILPVVEADALFSFNMLSSTYNKGGYVATLYYLGDWLNYSNFMPMPADYNIHGGHGYLYQGMQNLVEDATLLTVSQTYLD